jgi:hypothetical protein
MKRVALALVLALVFAACKSKPKRRNVLTPEASGGSAVAGSATSAASDEAEVQAAADAAAAAFERYVAQWSAVANSYDGKDCNAFVAQLTTLEPKLRDFTTPLAKYANDTKRMLAVEEKLKTKLVAMEGRMADPALGEKFKTAVQACEKHPEIQTALERGMMRKRKAGASGSATRPAGSAN